MSGEVATNQSTLVKYENPVIVNMDSGTRNVMRV